MVLPGLVNLVMELKFQVNGKPSKSQICGLGRSLWLCEECVEESGS